MVVEKKMKIENICENISRVKTVIDEDDEEFGYVIEQIDVWGKDIMEHPSIKGELFLISVMDLFYKRLITASCDAFGFEDGVPHLDHGSFMDLFSQYEVIYEKYVVSFVQ